MRLKPSFQKILASLFVSIVFYSLFSQFYRAIFFKGIVCPTMFAFCDYHSLFSHCFGLNCVSQLTYTIQAITLLLPSFLITYFIYSYFQNRKEKDIWKMILAILIILVLSINLVFLSNYLEEQDDKQKLAENSERAKIMRSLFGLSMNVWKLIKETSSTIPTEITSLLQTG